MANKADGKGRIFVVAVLVAVALAGPTRVRRPTGPVRAGTHPGKPLARRYIAFQSDRKGGKYHIFLYEMTTQALVDTPSLNATDSQSQDTCPAMSSDGRYIAFQSDRSSQSAHVFVYDRPASSFRPLYTMGSQFTDEHPWLTGDGLWIAFDSNRTKALWQLYMFNPQRGGYYDKQLAASAPKSQDLYPCCSADGGLVVFQSNRNSPGTNNYQVFLYDVNSKSVEPIPGQDDKSFSGFPNISPDGRYITYVSRRSGTHSALYLYDRNSAKAASRELLPSWTQDQLTPCMSKDDNRIAFSANRPGGQGGNDIYILDMSTLQVTSPTGLNSASNESAPFIQ